MTDIALASGFGSVRRFNALFQARYRMQPNRLRNPGNEGKQNAGNPAMRFELAYRPPLPWETMLAFLGQRAIQGVEDVAGAEYRRTVAIVHGGHIHRGWIAVRPAARRATLRVSVSADLARVVPPVLARIKRLFDLACDPHAVAAQLGPLAAAHPGLRVPGAFEGFELAVRAILGQQVTVKAATTLSGRIARTFGEPLATPWAGLTHTFPSATCIASLPLDAIASRGIIASRARSILALAARGRRRDAGAGAGCRCRSDDGGIARTARNRRVDGAIHRDAGAGVARRVSAYRPGRDEGAGRNLRQTRARSRGAVATVARLCGDALVAFAKTKGIDMISTTRFDSPLGRMLATAEDGALTGLYFVGQRYFPAATDDWHEDGEARPFALAAATTGRIFRGDATGYSTCRSIPAASAGRRSSVRCGAPLPRCRSGARQLIRRSRRSADVRRLRAPLVLRPGVIRCR